MAFCRSVIDGWWSVGQLNFIKCFHVYAISGFLATLRLHSSVSNKLKSIDSFATPPTKYIDSCSMFTCYEWNDKLIVIIIFCLFNLGLASFSHFFCHDFAPFSLFSFLLAIFDLPLAFYQSLFLSRSWLCHTAHSQLLRAASLASVIPRSFPKFTPSRYISNAL